ncbi:MAG: hypothetical protein ACREJO_19115 [Phycisphaerales bacterium]
MNRALAALTAVALCSGCVTEVVRKPPPQPPTPQPGKTTPSTPGGPSAAAPPTAPDATPRSRTGRLLLSVRPIGFIDYDGLTLPLVSPDGAMIAVSTGQPPTWPTLLAAPDAEPPLNTIIVAYDITQSPPKRIDWTPPLKGAVLGRSADRDGFLIEAPIGDGNRWIGHVRWHTGEVRWLVKGQNQAASHAILLRSGDLVFSRRRTGERVCELVIQSPDGSQRTLSEPGRSILMPLAAPDQRLFGAFSVSPDQTDLVVVAPEAGTNAQPLRAASRLTIAGFGSPVYAYQSAAGVEAAPNAVGQFPDPLSKALSSGLLYGNPRNARICLYETALGAESPMPPTVAAGAVIVNAAAAGVLATGEKSLEVFSASAGRLGAVEWGGATTGLNGPYVARSTASPDRFVLFGPGGPTDHSRLQVVGLQTLDAPPPGTAPILSEPKKAQ